MESQARRELREFYEGLSPEQRREQIVLRPAYRDFYNQLVQPDEMVVVPSYFWSKWLRVLKPTAASLYVVIREIAFKNKNQPEDSWCFPDQGELARMLGLSDRKTIRQHLNSLEKLGFLRRDQTYRITVDQAHGGTLARKGTCKYLVYYELPLVDEDAIALLLSQSKPLENNNMADRGDFPPYRNGGKASLPADVEGGFPPPSPTYPQEHTGTGGFAAGIPPNNNVSTTNLYPTLDNVREQGSFSKTKSQKPSAFKADPRVASLSSLERAQKEELVREIARTLNGCKGDHGNDEHKSAGFHRRAAYFMPNELVMQALMTVRDQHYDANVAGSKELRDAGAYFAGVIRKMAEQEGISLEPASGRRS